MRKILIVNIVLYFLAVVIMYQLKRYPDARDIPLYLFLALGVPVYLIPTTLAVLRKHPHKVAIILVNVIGGFIYAIGWFVALVWVFVTPSKRDNATESVADELKKMKDLMDDGVISEEEFFSRKKLLLEN